MGIGGSVGEIEKSVLLDAEWKTGKSDPYKHFGIYQPPLALGRQRHDLNWNVIANSWSRAALLRDAFLRKELTMRGPATVGRARWSSRVERENPSAFDRLRSMSVCL